MKKVPVEDDDPVHENGNFLQCAICLSPTQNSKGSLITTEAYCKDATMYYYQYNQVTNQLTFTIFISDDVQETKDIFLRTGSLKRFFSQPVE